jgi:2-oxoisovalerate dehydrogenase E1 component
MTKILGIGPDQARASDWIEFERIPVNRYDRTVAQERANFTDAVLMRIFRDMAVIREFETMLNSIKRTGEYGGMKCGYGGPAHLSMGQEAAAVGMAYNLTAEDFIFGSHRSHGEILAKGLSAIEKLPEDELMRVMRETNGGRTLSVVERNIKAGNARELAAAFLVYGAVSEIFAKETGFNRGLGGSMHAFFLPFGVYPNNAIVGGSADIATGAALFKKVNQRGGIVVANIGDGSIGCGPVWEALNFAAMDQFTTLWEEGYKGGLPILFNIFDNHYGMGGQTAGETMAYGMAARIGAGISPTQLHAERVDGFDPLAVIDAFARKKKLLQESKGPALLDVVTYRYSGHSPSDASTYRTEDEIKAWQAQDPLSAYPAELVQAGVTTEDAVAAIWEKTRSLLFESMRLAADNDVSPYISLAARPDAIADLMFSNKTKPAMAEGPCDSLIPKNANPRLESLRRKERFGLDAEGKPISKNKIYQLRDGLFEALLDKFYTDPTLIAYGEDNRDWGGAFAVYRGLTEAMPYHRFFNSPISEAAIVGTAVGYAMCGGRAVVELMYCDFMGRAGDEIFNQLSKWQSMSAGLLEMPVVLRLSIGMKYGAQHSQDWTAMAAHIPGLKVCYPATPYDAKGLMNAALAGTDPVLFFESQRLYDVGELFQAGGVPEGYYEIPLGLPDVKRVGSDVTILTIGAALYTGIAAADELRAKYGLSAEVIDARSLVPFDYAPVLESVKKTGKIVIVTEACERGSFAADLARNLTELAFDDLDAPPVVIGARNWITPATEMDSFFFPQPWWIVEAIHEKILPLPGYIPQGQFTNAAQIVRAKKGV